MVTTRLSPNAGDLLLLVGTVKGAFIFHSGPARRDFESSGPHLPGQQVFSAAYLPRTSRILLGNKSEHWGAMISRSDDFGQSWHEPMDGNIKLPKGSGLSLNAVWAIEPAPSSAPNVVYAGVDPAALYRSDDCGETFTLNEGLFKHPHRQKWAPGFGGLCLHSIALPPRDPGRIYVAISAAGVYRTVDRGKSWERCNRGVTLNPGVDPHPDFGQQCAHKIRLDPQNPARIYLQNHPGVYRSDDGADSWVSIENGLPSNFGFPLAVHPRRGDTAYVFPLTSDNFRYPHDGVPRIWRTRDAGATWEPLSKGLPPQNAYFTVLRDALVADALDPAGLYFGTRGGQVFASNDEGESWRALAQWLPPVLCVKAAVVS